MTEHKRYATLDELSRDLPAGTYIRFGESLRQQGHVIGYVYTLPMEVGRNKEPALVVDMHLGGFGHVYPHEITTRYPKGRS